MHKTVCPCSACSLLASEQVHRGGCVRSWGRSVPRATRRAEKALLSDWAGYLEANTMHNYEVCLQGLTVCLLWGCLGSRSALQALTRRVGDVRLHEHGVHLGGLATLHARLLSRERMRASGAARPGEHRMASQQVARHRGIA
eukprot:12743085-Alexandrium_andersonii.AAC.1